MWKGQTEFYHSEGQAAWQEEIVGFDGWLTRFAGAPVPFWFFVSLSTRPNPFRPELATHLPTQIPFAITNTAHLARAVAGLVTSFAASAGGGLSSGDPGTCYVLELGAGCCKFGESRPPSPGCC